MKLITDASTWRDAIRNIMTFRYLDDRELDQLLGAGAIMEFEGDEPIVTEGEVDQCFYGILKGTVSVNVQEPEKGDVFICALGPGEVFGEAGFFLKIRRTASVVAKDRVTVFQLTRSELTTFIKANPSGGNKILLITIYGLLRKLRAANQELAYERKGDMEQDDIDELVNGLLAT